MRSNESTAKCGQRTRVRHGAARVSATSPENFFATPPPLTDVTVRSVKTPGRSYERMVFDSGYAPKEGEPGRERWLGYTANSREYALLLRHPQPRPWLVCVHGAVMGRGLLDLTLFRAWHLHEDLGLNVGLTGAADARPTCARPAPGCGVPGRGRAR